MAPIIAIVAVIGMGIFGIARQHVGLVNQNQSLKAQVVILQKHQIPTVKQLDGVELKNLMNKNKNA